MNEELKNKIESAKNDEKYWNDETMVEDFIKQGYKKEEIDEVLTAPKIPTVKSLEKKIAWKIASSIFWKTTIAFIVFVLLFFIFSFNQILYSDTSKILAFTVVSIFLLWLVVKHVSKTIFSEHNDTQYNYSEIIKSAVFYFFFLSLLPGLIIFSFFTFFGVVALMAFSGGGDFLGGFLAFGTSVIGWFIQWILPTSIVESLIVLITLKQRLNHLKNPKSAKYGIIAAFTIILFIITGLSVVYMNKDVLLNSQLSKYFFEKIEIPKTLSNFTQTKSVNYLFYFGSKGKENGQFDEPRAVAVDSSGNIYVADTGNQRIQKFDSSEKYLSQLFYKFDNGQLGQPYGITFDSLGNIYVILVDNTSDVNDSIQKFDSSGKYLSQFGYNKTNNSQLDRPYGIAINSLGDVFVTDTGDSCVKKFDSSGKYLLQFGSAGHGNGQFDELEGIAIDSSDNIYVVDSSNQRVQKFDSSGNYISQFGSEGYNNGQFSYPFGIAIDSSDNIYVTDSGNSRVQKFDSSGAYIFHFGSGGIGNGRFNWPQGIAIDSSDNIYITDSSYSYAYVQKFSQTK